MIDFKIGDKVDYHSIIGGEITSTGHKIKYFQLGSDDYGTDVAWITGKSGCVALSALSHTNIDNSKTEFKREERYIVLKLKNLNQAQESFIRNFLHHEGIPTIQSVVTESDWDCYEDVWKLIEEEIKNRRTKK